MATCRYCKKSFKKMYDSETVCSRLCGSLALERQDEEFQRLESRAARLRRTILELQGELGKTSHLEKDPPAFTLEFIRAIVDGE